VSDAPTPPANCPTCRCRIVRRVAGPWCPRCQRFIVQRLVPVYTGTGETPLVLSWGVQARPL
jgi:hypothetical protein